MDAFGFLISFVGFLMFVWAVVIFSQIRQELAGIRAILSARLSAASTEPQANASGTKGVS